MKLHNKILLAPKQDKHFRFLFSLLGHNSYEKLYLINKEVTVPKSFLTANDAMPHHAQGGIGSSGICNAVNLLNRDKGIVVIL